MHAISDKIFIGMGNEVEDLGLYKNYEGEGFRETFENRKSYALLNCDDDFIYDSRSNIGGAQAFDFRDRKSTPRFKHGQSKEGSEFMF